MGRSRKPPPLGEQQGLFDIDRLDISTDSWAAAEIPTSALVEDASRTIAVSPTSKPERPKVDWRLAAETWVVEHPEGWRLFCRLMLEEIQKGKRFSVRDMIWPKMRWENPIAGTPVSAVIKYKLPNGLSPYFVRFFQDQHTEINLSNYISMGRIRC